MAYVVARKNGRFEVRESLHTASGPRARTLASFATLTGEVLAAAAARAQRPFDGDAVIESAKRAGAQVHLVDAGLTGRGRESVGCGEIVDEQSAKPKAEPDAAAKLFVEASRRMVKSLRTERPRQARDPGDALIDLLGFADEVARSQPARQREPLRFPAMARLVEARRQAAGQRSR